MSSSKPSVSVVMPVRNALPFLDASIESIVTQTHRDIELVIRDDASTDGSTDVLRAWARRDPRIRLFESSECLGPAGSSNWVVEQARAPIIARMDADDISHPDRIRRQLAALAQHPDAALVGSLCEGIDARGRRVRPRDLWRLDPRSRLAPFPHGSIVFRHAVFTSVGGYRAICDYWEDLDFFLRVAAQGRILVLPDALYQYRFSESSVRLATRDEEVERAVDLMYRCVAAHGAARPYDAMLDAARTQPPPSRFAPRVFLAIGTTRLWSGRSPAMLGRLLRRGRLGWDRETAVVLVWAVVGAISPRLLRLGLQAFNWARNLPLQTRFTDGRPSDWCPVPATAGD